MYKEVFCKNEIVNKLKYRWKDIESEEVKEKSYGVLVFIYFSVVFFNIVGCNLG